MPSSSSAINLSFSSSNQGSRRSSVKERHNAKAAKLLSQPQPQPQLDNEDGKVIAVAGAVPGAGAEGTISLKPTGKNDAIEGKVTGLKQEKPQLETKNDKVVRTHSSTASSSSSSLSLSFSQGQSSKERRSEKVGKFLSPEASSKGLGKSKKSQKNTKEKKAVNAQKKAAHKVEQETQRLESERKKLQELVEQAERDLAVALAAQEKAGGGRLLTSSSGPSGSIRTELEDIKYHLEGKGKRGEMSNRMILVEQRNEDDTYSRVSEITSPREGFLSSNRGVARMGISKLRKATKKSIKPVVKLGKKRRSGRRSANAKSLQPSLPVIYDDLEEEEMQSKSMDDGDGLGGDATIQLLKSKAITFSSTDTHVEVLFGRPDDVVPTTAATTAAVNGAAAAVKSPTKPKGKEYSSGKESKKSNLKPNAIIKLARAARSTTNKTVGTSSKSSKSSASGSTESSKNGQSKDTSQTILESASYLRSMEMNDETNDAAYATGQATNEGSVRSKSSPHSTPSSSASSATSRLKRLAKGGSRGGSRLESQRSEGNGSPSLLFDTDITPTSSCYEAESIGGGAAVLSNVTSSEILAVNESQPLGGPKYYIATNTKSGEAKVIHEAMPTMATPMSSSFAVAEEMGYEVLEYDLERLGGGELDIDEEGRGIIYVSDDDDSVVSYYTSATGLTTIATTDYERLRMSARKTTVVTEAADDVSEFTAETEANANNRAGFAAGSADAADDDTQSTSATRATEITEPTQYTSATRATDITEITTDDDTQCTPATSPSGTEEITDDDCTQCTTATRATESVSVNDNDDCTQYTATTGDIAPAEVADDCTQYTAETRATASSRITDDGTNCESTYETARLVATTTTFPDDSTYYTCETKGPELTGAGADDDSTHCTSVTKATALTAATDDFSLYFGTWNYWTFKDRQ